jgi:hypothetical protein
MHRRQVLHGVALGSVVGLAGCSELFPWNRSELVTELTVRNRRETGVTVDLTVADEAGTQLASRQLSLDGGHIRELDGLVAEPGTYALTVAVDGGPSSQHEWPVSDCTSTTIVVEPDGVDTERSVC